MEQDFGSGSVDTRTDISPVEETPRRIAGLNVGRILNFVIASGAVRPLLVTNPLDQFGPVNGVLFFDPSSDSAESLGVPLLPNKYGHAPLFCLPLSGVPYDELGLLVGSWHWPSRPAAALAASVDPAALSTQLDALLAPVLALIDEKLAAHLATTNELVDNCTALITSAVNSGKAGEDHSDRPVPSRAGIQGSSESYASYDSVGDLAKEAVGSSPLGGYGSTTSAGPTGDSTPAPETPANVGGQTPSDDPNLQTR